MIVAEVSKILFLIGISGGSSLGITICLIVAYYCLLLLLPLWQSSIYALLSLMVVFVYMLLVESREGLERKVGASA